MKTIYENNLNTLEQHHKTLWEAFSRDSSLEENEFAFATQAKNGEWIVGCHMEGKDNYMNSTYNPAREACRRTPFCVCLDLQMEALQEHTLEKMEKVLQSMSMSRARKFSLQLCMILI